MPEFSSVWFVFIVTGEPAWYAEVESPAVRRLPQVQKKAGRGEVQLRRY